MNVDTAENSSFSTRLPGLQIAVDSTSLGEFKICPRRYYYRIILGYQARVESVHLTFGILFHSAIERYDHYKSVGLDHEQALRDVLRWLLCETWNKTMKRPWISDHKTKNRGTLVRSVVWYLDEFGGNDPLKTVQLANGKPAVELSFSFDSGFQTQSGEPWLLCGHMDRIATLNDVPYIVDHKTTEHTIDAGYFSKFSPDNQFSMYTLAGRVAFQQPIKALIVDVTQVAVTFSRFQRGLVNRDDAQVAEWHKDTGHYLRQMEDCALHQDWPQNDKSCGMYGGCEYRSVCSRSPVARDQWLKADFKTRIWDPLKRRGDI